MIWSSFLVRLLCAGYTRAGCKCRIVIIWQRWKLSKCYSNKFYPINTNHEIQCFSVQLPLYKIKVEISYLYNIIIFFNFLNCHLLYHTGNTVTYLAWFDLTLSRADTNSLTNRAGRCLTFQSFQDTKPRRWKASMPARRV